MSFKERIRRRGGPEGPRSRDSAASTTTIVGEQRRIVPYLFSGPGLIVISLVMAFPIVFALYRSLFAVSPVATNEPFVGLDNYIRVFSDPQFWSSLGRTAIFVGGVIVLGLFLSIVFAFALNRLVSGLRFIRGLAILPYIVSSVAAAMMFRTLFNSEFGLPNRVVEFFGAEGLAWFSTPALAMVVVIVAQVWTDLPLALLFILGGLQTIDQSYTDAARVDGASGIRSAIYISLPLIGSQLVLATIWLSYKAVTSLGTVLALTGGGPGTATQLLTVEMYNLGFQQFDMGAALAVVIVIFVLNVVLTLSYLKLQRKFGFE